MIKRSIHPWALKECKLAFRRYTGESTTLSEQEIVSCDQYDYGCDGERALGALCGLIYGSKARWGRACRLHSPPAGGLKPLREAAGGGGRGGGGAC